jgi:hypothetical protein
MMAKPDEPQGEEGSNAVGRAIVRAVRPLAVELCERLELDLDEDDMLAVESFAAACAIEGAVRGFRCAVNEAEVQARREGKALYLELTFDRPHVDVWADRHKHDGDESP